MTLVARRCRQYSCMSPARAEQHYCDPPVEQKLQDQTSQDFGGDDDDPNVR